MIQSFSFHLESFSTAVSFCEMYVRMLVRERRFCNGLREYPANLLQKERYLTGDLLALIHMCSQVGIHPTEHAIK